MLIIGWPTHLRSWRPPGNPGSTTNMSPTKNVILFQTHEFLVTISGTFLQSTFSFLNDSIGPESLGRLLSSNRKASFVSYLILATTSGLDISSLSFSAKGTIKFHGKSLALSCVDVFILLSQRDLGQFPLAVADPDFLDGGTNP